jgi:hypothetical protein
MAQDDPDHVTPLDNASTATGLENQFQRIMQGSTVKWVGWVAAFAAVPLLWMLFENRVAAHVENRVKEEMANLRYQSSPTPGHRDHKEVPGAIVHKDAGHSTPRFLSMFTKMADPTTATATTGCIIINLMTASQTLDLSAKSCNGFRCPPCFLVDMASSVFSLTLPGCSTMYVSNDVKMGDDPLQQTANTIMVINKDPGITAKISDGTAEYLIPGSSFMELVCYTGGVNRMYGQKWEAGV